MIMLRSNTAAKMGKPPPPVPPRPSKNTVAEALAKTKRMAPDVPYKPSIPLRTAPPPPILKPQLCSDENKINPIMKSQSYCTVSVVSKPNLERSISQEQKKSRTVIYESPNMKTKVQITRKPSDKMVKPTVIRKESFKDEKMEKNDNWSDVLNDRNHVNTLIDEMFAEVLNNRDCVKSEDAKSEESEDGKSEGVLISSESIILKSKDELIKTENVITKSEDAANKYEDATIKIEDIVESDNVLNTEDKIKSEDIGISPDKTMIKIHNNQEEKATPTVLVIEDSSEEASSSNSSTGERNKHVQFDDKRNHELLINELQNMKMEQERILKRQRKPSKDIFENEGNDVKIQHSDWIEVNNGQEVRLSSCQITIDEKSDSDGGDSKVNPLISRLSAMSNLHGLPPLPKSLSNFSFMEGPQTPNRSRNTTPPIGANTHLVYPPHPKPNSNGAQSNLDAQLAILRREMYSLRQLDLSLLSQLWSLNESIQDFRQILQDQEESVLSPPSPSPPSSGDEDEADEYYSPSPMRFRPAPPPPALRRTSNSSSDNSSV